MVREDFRLSLSSKFFIDIVFFLLNIESDTVYFLRVSYFSYLSLSSCS